MLQDLTKVPVELVVRFVWKFCLYSLSSLVAKQRTKIRHQQRIPRQHQQLNLSTELLSPQSDEVIGKSTSRSWASSNPCIFWHRSRWASTCGQSACGDAMWNYIVNDEGESDIGYKAGKIESGMHTTTGNIAFDSVLEGAVVTKQRSGRQNVSLYRKSYIVALCIKSMARGARLRERIVGMQQRKHNSFPVLWASAHDVHKQRQNMSPCACSPDFFFLVTIIAAAQVDKSTWSQAYVHACRDGNTTTQNK